MTGTHLVAVCVLFLVTFGGRLIWKGDPDER